MLLELSSFPLTAATVGLLADVSCLPRGGVSNGARFSIRTVGDELASPLLTRRRVVCAARTGSERVRVEEGFMVGE